jgi:hypothetical protein
MSLARYKRARRANIAITPDNIFSATDQYRHFIRHNAANWPRLSKLFAVG